MSRQKTPHIRYHLPQINSREEIFSSQSKYLFFFILVLSVLGAFSLGVSEAEAAVSAETGSFIKCTTGLCTDNITVGFQPKAVIFYFSTATTSVTTQFSPNDGGFGFGFTDGGNASTKAYASAFSYQKDLDSNSSSDDARILSTTTAITIITATDTTIDAQATTTFNSTGFQVGWSSTNTSGAQVIYYYALGGTDITNVDIGEAVATSTGIGSYSDASLSFQPDFLLFLVMQSRTANTNNTVSAAGTESGLGLGWATSSAAQGAIGTGARDAQTTGIDGHSHSDAHVILAHNRDAIDTVASLTSMNANGFTINITNAPTVNLRLPYLAIKGGRHRIQAFSQPTSAGSQATTSVGFQPVGLAMFSVNDATSLANATARTTNPALRISFGTATSSGGHSIWAEETDTDLFPHASSLSTTTKIMVMASTTVASGAILAHAEVTSLDATGFTLNWVNADATARKVFYWAIGSNAAAAAVPTLTTDTATGVGVASATLNGNITDTGGSNATVRGFAWGTDSALSINTATTTESGDFGTGTFSQTISGLLAGKVYYFRSYATNTTGTGYGSTIDNFTTSTDTTTSRKLRLFDGKVKFIDGRIILHQN